MKLVLFFIMMDAISSATCRLPTCNKCLNANRMPIHVRVACGRFRACCAVKYWKHNSIFRSCKKKSKSEDEAKANCHEPVYEMKEDETYEESLKVIAEMKETSYFKSFYNRLKRIFRKKNKSYTD